MKKQIGAAVGVGLVSYYALSHYMFRRMTRGKRKTPEMLLAQYSVADQTFYHNVPFEEQEMISYDGFKLHGRIYRNVSSRNWIVFVHGYTTSKSFMAPHLALFHRLGYNLLAIDLRSHGESEGVYASYGYHEKFDVLEWVEWLRDREAIDTIGLHGVSMGAATILQVEPAAEVDFLIAECPFNDLTYLMDHHITRLNHLPFKVFAPGLDYFLWSRAGFRMHEVSPKQVVKEAKTPILFIHGSNDNFVPTWMSREMHALNSNSELAIINGAEHTDCLKTDPAAYEAAVTRFLQKLRTPDRPTDQTPHE